MAGSGTGKENMGKGREIMRSVLNPAAPEFFPQNYHQPFLIPNIITTTHQYHYNNYLYSNNSHNYFLVPPPLPPPPPPTHFPLAVPADEAEDQPQRHHHYHHHHHHDQTALVAVAADHHHDEEENRRRNQRRPRRRGSGVLGRKTRRRVLRGNSLCERNCTDQSKRGERYSSSSSEVLPLLHGANYSTVMIRNIPSKYTRQMLLDFLDDHCMLQNQSRVVNNNAAGEDDEQTIISALDFLYLPMDFRTELNKGYAFVNFTSPQAASKFSEAANGQTWDHFHSFKIREIARARLQGKEELIRHFESMVFPCGSEEFLPVWFVPPRDGTNKESVTETTVGKLVGNYYRKPNHDQQVLPR